MQYRVLNKPNSPQDSGPVPRQIEPSTISNSSSADMLDDAMIRLAEEFRLEQVNNLRRPVENYQRPIPKESLNSTGRRVFDACMGLGMLGALTYIWLTPAPQSFQLVMTAISGKAIIGYLYEAITGKSF